MARRISRRRLEAALARFTIRRYTVPEWGPHRVQYLEQKAKAEIREAAFDALPPPLRATINAVGDNNLARDLARKKITNHAQCEKVKAMIYLESAEINNDF